MYTSQMADGGGTSAGADKLGVSCKFCGTSENLRRCARCKRAYYCSRDHQRQHWHIHSSECHVPLRSRPPLTTTSSPPSPSPQSLSSSSSMNSRNTIPESRNNNNDIPGIPLTNGNGLISDKSRSLLSQSTASKSKSGGRVRTANSGSSPTPSTSGFVNDTSLEGGNNSHFSIIRTKLKMHSKHAENILVNTQRMERTCQQIVYDLSTQGICQFDQFLGTELGTSILEEVQELYKSGVFREGQLVNNRAQNAAGKIRGDKIAWIGEIDDRCRHIGDLIGIVDTLITRCNKMPDNGELGKYELTGRTKAMVACYPGDGAQYVKHVDNPNNDGRCITCIYYLNKNWNETHGGCLIISPTGKDCDAIIKPEFDRIVFFWSDRRNPHQVQKSYETRYAITIWYLDKREREQAQLKDHAR